jgi:hypothetical protein
MCDAQSHFFSHCPHCSAGLRIRRAYLGQQVCCKQCDQVFVAAEGPNEGGGVPAATLALPLPVDQAERIVVTCPVTSWPDMSCAGTGPNFPSTVKI